MADEKGPSIACTVSYYCTASMHAGTESLGLRTKDFWKASKVRQAHTASLPSVVPQQLLQGW